MLSPFSSTDIKYLVYEIRGGLHETRQKTLERRFGGE